MIICCPPVTTRTRTRRVYIADILISVVTFSEYLNSPLPSVAYMRYWTRIVICDVIFGAKPLTKPIITCNQSHLAEQNLRKIIEIDKFSSMKLHRNPLGSDNIYTGFEKYKAFIEIWSAECWSSQNKFRDHDSIIASSLLTQILWSSSSGIRGLCDLVMFSSYLLCP